MDLSFVDLPLDLLIEARYPTLRPAGDDHRPREASDTPHMNSNQVDVSTVLYTF